MTRRSCLFSAAAAVLQAAGPRLSLEWSKLRNPILTVSDRMLTDAAIVYRDGYFHLFSSMRLDEGDARDWSKEWQFYRSRDLRTWKPFHPSGLDQRGQHPDSPDVISVAGRYVMVF